VTWYRVRKYLGSSLWFVPVLCVLAGIGLAFGTIALDRLADGSLVPRSLSGDPDAALAILMTVAASMVTLTALVLTITMVVVQLAMGQFTPRVLRTILRDRPSQLAIGVFVATFAHAMLVMREVRAPGNGDDGYVPGLAIVVSFVLIIVSIVVLVWYVNHIGQSLRVASLIDAVGDDTRRLLDRLHPSASRTELPQRDGVIAATDQGVVVKLDTDALVHEAQRTDAVIELVHGLGDFVPRGAILFQVRGGSRVDGDALLHAVALGNERTLDEDLAYGFRLLVDVAVRAVSEAMSDPSTATQAIDRIHDLLRQLATRPLPDGRHFDNHGELRLLVPTLSWDGYVRLAVDELRMHGRHSVQVIRRLEAMLNDLLEIAPPDRRIVLEQELSLIDIAVPSAFDADLDRRAATTPDQQGIGSGADVLIDPEPQVGADGSHR
jgi:uncharacterized membrane protein